MAAFRRKLIKLKLPGNWFKIGIKKCLYLILLFGSLPFFFKTQKYEVVVVKPPHMKYEQHLVGIRTNVEILRDYLSSEFDKIAKEIPHLTNNLNTISKMVIDHQNVLLNDLDYLKKIDGYEEWREIEHKQLSDLVQNRFKYLQNPKDCKTAKKLICHLEELVSSLDTSSMAESLVYAILSEFFIYLCQFQGSGWGSEMHRMVYCFIMAYTTGRTAIINSTGWQYHKEGWDAVFLPISDTCSTFDDKSIGKWNISDRDTEVLDLPHQERIDRRDLRVAIPNDISERLMRFHGAPIVWWVGQIFAYFVRPLPKVQNFIDATMKRIGFQTSTVGVHIRRYDKVAEAAAHNVEEYMKYVDEYYDRLEMVQPVEKRSIFLATDEMRTILEVKNKYPNYEIITNAEGARLANLTTRYTDASGYGILLDVLLLSKTDYLVCTHSSNVCRMAYELMQARDGHSVNRVKSLDHRYHFYGQAEDYFQAILPHTAANEDEISFNVGDLINVRSYYQQNGLWKGDNQRTKKYGWFPAYKVKDKTEVYNFPKYPDNN